MNWKRVGAIGALVAGVVGYILWFIAHRKAEEARIRAEVAARRDYDPWLLVKGRVEAEVQAKTEALASARSDEIKRLFEAAFPRKRDG